MRKLILLMILILPLGLLAQMDPGTYLRDYLRIRSDLSGKDSVYHIQGKVYSLIPGEKSMELFAYDAFQISRIVETEAGFRLLAREAGVFRDHRTRQILHSWRNPFTQETLPIIHIWNDPVNQVFEYEANTLPFIRQFLPSTELEDKVVYHSEIFPFYPHVLPRRLFGEYVQSDYFQSAELHEFSAEKAALADSLASWVPAEVSFTWIAPWLPFMKMGDREGQLLFVCRGTKLEEGFAALPQDLQEYVRTTNPAFTEAPTEFSEPNINPWSYFRILQEPSLETR